MKASKQKPITPSTRLRNVLFVLWQQKQPDCDFDTFYLEKMNYLIGKIINQLEG